MKRCLARRGGPQFRPQPVGEECRLGIALEQFGDDPGVKDFVASFIGRDLLADLREILLALLQGEPGEIAVRQPGGTIVQIGEDDVGEIINRRGDRSVVSMAAIATKMRVSSRAGQRLVRPEMEF